MSSETPEPTGALCGPEDDRIGMPVQVVFEPIAGDVVLPQFRRVTA